MSDRSVRKACVAPLHNLSMGNSCSDDDPCTQCSMQRDIDENPELYEALEG